MRSTWHLSDLYVDTLGRRKFKWIGNLNDLVYFASNSNVMNYSALKSGSVFKFHPEYKNSIIVVVVLAVVLQRTREPLCMQSR